MNTVESIEIHPSGPIWGQIRPPGSKSITNRALVCAALAEGTSRLSGALDSEDTQVMIAALEELGVRIERDADRTELVVHGVGTAWGDADTRLFLANSGTSIRFLTAMVTLGRRRVVLDGIARMRQRPIQDLVDALNGLGGHTACLESNGCPPVEVVGNGLLNGGQVEMKGDVSSQYLSAVLMIAPYAKLAVEIGIRGPLVSQPYVEMTRAVMKSFGVSVESTDGPQYRIAPGQRYQAGEYAIEPDASAASYFWGAAAVTGGDVLVEGLQSQALQGDVGFCECLRQMGCQVTEERDGLRVTGPARQGIDVDMADISDTVQTLAVVALFVDGPTRIRGVAHNRHKETDRIGDLATELRRLGAEVAEHEDGLTIQPRPLQAAQIKTYGDHRMAMSFALAGLQQPGIRILDPACTGKTYPHYFEDLARLVGR